MISVDDLTYSVGDFRLRDVSLEIAEGEYFVLLGRPGSGKSIFLECLCGLNRVSAGAIRIAGVDVTSAEPRDRGIGYVPQDYALFSTKLVRDNITFGLDVRGIPGDEIAVRLDDITQFLNIQRLLDRSVHGLSGGEQQKVALARALIVKPKVLLLDEPVSALDEATRETVCMELKHIQQETGTTTVHVSHNFEETRIVADRVGILDAGQLVQVGAPDQVFNHPANTDIAAFLRVGNILEGYAEPDGEHTRVTVGDTVLIASGAPSRCHGAVEFALPARDIFVSIEPPDNDFENCVTGSIVNSFPRGLVTRVTVEVGRCLTLTALAPPYFHRTAPDTKVYVSFPASAIHVFR